MCLCMCSCAPTSSLMVVGGPAYTIQLEVAMKTLQCACVCGSCRNCDSRTEAVRKSEKCCWDLVFVGRGFWGWN